MMKVTKSKVVTKIVDCNGVRSGGKALKEEEQKCFKPIFFKVY